MMPNLVTEHTTSTPLGCYADDPADPDLPYVSVGDPDASMWPEACLSYCYDMVLLFTNSWIMAVCLHVCF